MDVVELDFILLHEISHAGVLFKEFFSSEQTTKYTSMRTKYMLIYEIFYNVPLYYMFKSLNELKLP